MQRYFCEGLAQSKPMLLLTEEGIPLICNCSQSSPRSDSTRSRSADRRTSDFHAAKEAVGRELRNSALRSFRLQVYKASEHDGAALLVTSPLLNSERDLRCHWRCVAACYSQSSLKRRYSNLGDCHVACASWNSNNTIMIR